MVRKGTKKGKRPKKTKKTSRVNDPAKEELELQTKRDSAARAAQESRLRATQAQREANARARDAALKARERDINNPMEDELAVEMVKQTKLEKAQTARDKAAAKKQKVAAKKTEGGTQSS